MDRWIKIRSWHRLTTFTRAGGALTRCGRRVDPPLTTADDFPVDEKTCESCLRLEAASE